MITRQGAMAVVQSEDRNQVLLLRREFFLLWDLPGGGVEKNEEPAVAAVRETCEETGYAIEITRATGTYVHQSVYGRGDQLTYAYSARVVGGSPNRYNLESTGLAWFPLDRLPRGLEPLHRQIIADAFAERTPVERRIDFPRWKLYPARVVFTIVRAENALIKKVLHAFGRSDKTERELCQDEEKQECV